MSMSVEDVLKEFNITCIKTVEYYKVTCPFHDDNKPSGTIHHRTGFFRCWVCNKQTSLTNYLVKYSNLPIYQVKIKSGVRSDCKNPISPLDVEQHHVSIWDHPTFIDALRYRQITDDDIRQYRLGIYNSGTEKRISIPILNAVGEYCNLRLYIPGAKDRKFLNLSGKDRSKIRLFPIEQLEYDQILVCGGELKAVAAARILNRYDIGAVAPTCGENVWPDELTNEFTGKLVYVNCDIDKTGAKYAELRCRKLKSVVRELHKVVFTTEMVGGEEKGDINDYIRLGGDLYKLLLDSPEWIMVPGGEMVDEVPMEIAFRDAYTSSNVSKRVAITAVISGVNPNSYLAPSLVEVQCPRGQAYCITCDVNNQAYSTNTEMKIGKEHPVLLGIIASKDEEHTRIFKNCFKIPNTCRLCTFKRLREYNVTEIRLDEQMEPSARTEPMIMKIAYIVDGPPTIESQTYNMVGRLYPSPRNQVASFLISQIEPTSDALESYVPMNAEYLRIFQPDEWTLYGIERKLNDIYSDFEANVTRIWLRRDYHVAIDLTYHSVLDFNFGEIKNVKGYIEILAIGDTRQGKSHALDRMKDYYGLGYKVDSKNVSLPGLTIGIDMGSGSAKRFTILGILPRHDRRLIIFEEIGGMPQQIFQGLTEVRSSGYVQISKIEQKTRRARVRIIAISNPPEAREIASYTFGIESAISVIGTHQDLSRFDITMILGKKDIDQKELSEILQNPPKRENIYTDEQCQRLILKAWKCEHVIFEDTKIIIDTALRLVGIFGDGLPILDPNSTHIKIARLSAALAARTCSYENIDGIDKLIVRKCHVEYIEQYLIRIYSSPSSKLNEKSKSVRDSMMMRDKEGLISYLKSINNAADVMQKIKESDVITSQFTRDLCGDFFLGTTLFAKLIQSNAINRIKGDKYCKTAQFTLLLSEISFDLAKPEYIARLDF